MQISQIYQIPWIPPGTYYENQSHRIVSDDQGCLQETMNLIDFITC